MHYAHIKAGRTVFTADEEEEKQRGKFVIWILVTSLYSGLSFFLLASAWLLFFLTVMELEGHEQDMDKKGYYSLISFLLQTASRG